MDRQELERDCMFVGFMLFRNELKSDTGDALAQLKGGGCRVVMITGDNANTACYIARESGMIDTPEADSRLGEAQIVIADVNEKDTVEWRMVILAVLFPREYVSGDVDSSRWEYYSSVLGIDDG
jgi:magnesium-transporting ATPase (P-type)